ncbi:MAG: hypothetical protein HY719_10160 [Planctomycetes bacterium]|nr:hypothetical protein [Planctomycetota bacterium]
MNELLGEEFSTTVIRGAFDTGHKPAGRRTLPSVEKELADVRDSIAYLVAVAGSPFPDLEDPPDRAKARQEAATVIRDIELAFLRLAWHFFYVDGALGILPDDLRHRGTYVSQYYYSLIAPADRPDPTLVAPDADLVPLDTEGYVESFFAAPVNPPMSFLCSARAISAADRLVVALAVPVSDLAALWEQVESDLKAAFLAALSWVGRLVHEARRRLNDLDSALYPVLTVTPSAKGATVTGQYLGRDLPTTTLTPALAETLNALLDGQRLPTVGDDNRRDNVRRLKDGFRLVARYIEKANKAYTLSPGLIARCTRTPRP